MREEFAKFGMLIEYMRNNSSQSDILCDSASIYVLGATYRITLVPIKHIHINSDAAIGNYS